LLPAITLTSTARKRMRPAGAPLVRKKQLDLTRIFLSLANMGSMSNVAAAAGRVMVRVGDIRRSAQLHSHRTAPGVWKMQMMRIFVYD
jgi:hypothetical protein